MYQVCPKCGYHRGEQDTGSPERCPSCGVIYKKWLQQQLREARPRATRAEVVEASRFVLLVEQLLTPKDDDRLFWGGRLLAWLLLFWLGLEMLATGYSEAVMGDQSRAVNFIHGIDLIFHEAGHVVFRFLGDFMMVLGGSLLQVLVPLLVAGAFLLKNADPFGASVGLWWTGQSLSDVAIYIRDAREMQLQLLGGGTGMDRPGFHDWHNLLSRLGWLEHERTLAALVNGLGIVLMLLALLWGGVLLWRQWRIQA